MSRDYDDDNGAHGAQQQLLQQQLVQYRIAQEQLIKVSEEIAATTDARPLSALAQVFRTATFSSKDSVAPSPKEPKATTPVQPFSTSHWQWPVMNAWSICELFAKHVVIAGMTPCHFIVILQGVAPESRATTSLQDSNNAREISVDARSPWSIRKETRQPRRRHVLDTGPCRSVSAIWQRATRHVFEHLRTRHPRSGRGTCRALPELQARSAARKLSALR